MYKIFLGILTLSLCIIINCTNKSELPADLDLLLAPLFQETEGAFVIHDLNNNYTTRYHARRCKRQLPPCSTFKIAHAAIALETGVVPDSNFTIPWDSVKVPRQTWWKTVGLDWGREHNLHSAIQNSVVWVFQEIARRIGPEQMQSYLNRLDYGNRDISGGIDQFWLVNSLLISANEQIDFLKKFYTGKTPFSKTTTDLVKKFLLVEQTDSYRLYAKTGGGMLDRGLALGWYVGWVTRKNNTYLFALNIEGSSFNAIRNRRKTLTHDILKKLTIID